MHVVVNWIISLHCTQTQRIEIMYMTEWLYAAHKLNDVEMVYIHDIILYFAHKLCTLQNGYILRTNATEYYRDYARDKMGTTHKLSKEHLSSFFVCSEYHLPPSGLFTAATYLQCSETLFP